jgi:hypothetical protein
VRLTDAKGTDCICCIITHDQLKVNLATYVSSIFNFIDQVKLRGGARAAYRVVTDPTVDL